MRFSLLFSIILLTGSVNIAHPLHLSITNISVEDREIRIRMKTFRDDWEVAYFHYYSRIIDFRSQADRDIPWFRDYLEKSFRISLKPDSPPLQLEVDTIMVNDMDMEIEMHAELKREPNSLYICNTLLTDIYPDQTNLVIIGFRNRESGIRFDVRKHEEEISLR
ncbi:MAG: hypothetical protein JXR52_00330 [Bacteroidales bacterium]|nr:hypothetical protein [Bacteroidales bacterium]MBN2697240.1 hypothetical protein [Bacteroidales bacterium]